MNARIPPFHQRACPIFSAALAKTQNAVVDAEGRTSREAAPCIGLTCMFFVLPQFDAAGHVIGGGCAFATLAEAAALHGQNLVQLAARAQNLHPPALAQEPAQS